MHFDFGVAAPKNIKKKSGATNLDGRRACIIYTQHFTVMEVMSTANVLSTHGSDTCRLELFTLCGFLIIKFLINTLFFMDNLID